MAKAQSKIVTGNDEAAPEIKPEGKVGVTVSEVFGSLNTVAALGKEAGRLHLLAKAMGPAFIEYVRGQPVAFVQGNRPGTSVVSEVIGLAIITHCRLNVLLSTLAESGLLKLEEFQRDEKNAIEAFVNAAETRLGVTITETEVRPAY